MNCRNCGQLIDPTDKDNATVTLPIFGKVTVCGRCERTGKEMQKAFEDGITLTYKDGTTEILKPRKKK